MTRGLGWLVRAVPVALVLPVLGGAGICGNVLVDITQRELVLEPAATVDFAVDSGNVEIYAFARNGVSLFYYMVGSLEVIGDVGHSFADDTLQVVSECHGDGFCNVDWYAEIMLGTAVVVDANGGGVKVTGVDAPVTAEVEGGDFDGVGLRAPQLDVTVDEGNATVAFAAVPARATISVGTGDVAVTLPMGSYRCQLDTTDGEIDTTGVTCDDAAASVVEVTIESGNIVLVPGAPP